MLDQTKLRRTLGHVGQLLVAGDFEGLERLTGGRRLTAEEMRQAVRKYGRCLVPPPGGEWLGRSVVEIDNAVPEAWSVYLDLWTAEEGRSDLTLELTLRDSPAGIYSVELDDLHVL